MTEYPLTEDFFYHTEHQAYEGKIYRACCRTCFKKREKSYLRFGFLTKKVNEIKRKIKYHERIVDQQYNELIEEMERIAFFLKGDTIKEEHGDATEE